MDDTLLALWPILAILLTPILFGLVVMLMVYGALKLVRKLGGCWSAAVVGMIIVGVIGYFCVDVYRTCMAEPLYVPPACPNDCGEGRYIFPCDGPGGIAPFFFMYLMGPFIIAVIVIMTIWIISAPLRKPRM